MSTPLTNLVIITSSQEPWKFSSPIKKLRRKVYLYQKGDYESMRKDTLEFAKEKYFNGHSDTRSVQENFDLLTSFIQDSADKHIPSKTSRSVSSIPWITPEIWRKIRRKNKTHVKAKKTGSNKLRSNFGGERGGSVVECRTPEREVGGSKPTAAVLCPWARHFTPRKYWLITPGSGGSVPTWLKNCWLGR